MNPCSPLAPIAHAVSPMLRHRVHRAVHYAVSHKAKAAVGHHAVSAHKIAHLPIIRHPRPPVHHVAAPKPDTGACGVSDTTRKLHAADGPTGAGKAGAGKAGAGKASLGKAGAGAARLAGLTAGGAAVGIGAVAAIAAGGTGGGSPGPGGGDGFPGYAGPGFSGPGLTSAGGGSGSGGGGTGSGGVGGGGPHVTTPLPPTGGTPVVVTSHDTPPVAVPEPSTMVILTMALLALKLTRWVAIRR